MQLVEILCYVFLTISATAICAQAETLKTNATEKKDRVLRKRDTTLLSSNFESEPLYYTSNVIYKKMSRSNYRKQKPKHTVRRVRPSYGQLAYSHKNSIHRPRKNYKNAHFITQKPSYNEKHKTYASKHKLYGYKRLSSKKATTKKPIHRFRPYQNNYEQQFNDLRLRDYGEHKIADYLDTKQKDFGEPPKFREYGEPPKRDYAEPPKLRDYGAITKIRDFVEPLGKNFGENKLNDFGEPPVRELTVSAEPYIDIYKPKPAFLETLDPAVEGTTNFKSVIGDPSLFYDSELKSFNSHKFENPSHKRFTFHKKHPFYMKDEGAFNIVNIDNAENNRYGRESNKRMPYLKVNKFVNTGWKLQNEPEEDIVGGQYAEPPARYVPKFLPSAPMFKGDNDFEPPISFDDEELPSATAASPYVNYKNSNMAFSPQNLNDAFSVD